MNKFIFITTTISNGILLLAQSLIFLGIVVNPIIVTSISLISYICDFVAFIRFVKQNISTINNKTEDE